MYSWSFGDTLTFTATRADILGPGVQARRQRRQKPSGDGHFCSSRFQVSGSSVACRVRACRLSTHIWQRAMERRTPRHRCSESQSPCLNLLCDYCLHRPTTLERVATAAAATDLRPWNGARSVTRDPFFGMLTTPTPLPIISESCRAGAAPWSAVYGIPFTEGSLNTFHTDCDDTSIGFTLLDGRCFTFNPKLRILGVALATKGGGTCSGSDALARSPLVACLPGDRGERLAPPQFQLAERAG